MRRAIGPRWPALSRHFGVHPWDVERLTFDELAGYLDALDEVERAMRAGR